jgi:hypothetical protein
LPVGRFYYKYSLQERKKTNPVPKAFTSNTGLSKENINLG